MEGLVPDLSIHSFLPKAKAYIQQAQPVGVPNWTPNNDFMIQALGQGEYNMNFLVQQGQTAWVLRVNTGSQIGVSLSEQIAYEYNTLKLLSPSGVAPIPYFLDNSLKFLPYGILGMSYLRGEKLDYTRDNEKAANLMARYHQIEVPDELNHLIREEKPLTLTYQRCLRMMAVYLESDLADPDFRDYLIEVRDWAGEARHREIYYQQDPWNCIINTEVNNTNWILNRKAGTLHLVDWEKPLWGDPSQDLSHFRVPTTTLWKTDYRMSEADKKVMMDAYKNAIADPHLRDTIEERTRLRDPFNCLRGVSWCAMAWVQYQRGDHLLKNPDTYRKLSMYVDIDFVRGLFDPYMKNNPV
ncbi:MAG TPA: aminoglycoside phosphotransferase family protein [Anaerolineaceae bacterium]|jgi:thiamine kinase-like enzyme|nr:MAG: putative homoserine kinase type II (protein kinase fold) [Marinimicrobia bacterium 46_43]HAF48370.1 aminoglycoside phosphotransferase family protein [Anaerolineaceae bacterium]